MSVPKGKLMRAAGTIRRARFVNVYASANHQVEEADANERTIGIATDSGREAALPSVTDDPPNAAIEGDDVLVHLPGDEALLEIGSGGCTAGGELKSDADGKGVARATTGTTVQEIGAVALETASEGELAKVLVVYTSVRPALV